MEVFDLLPWRASDTSTVGRARVRHFTLNENAKSMRKQDMFFATEHDPR